MKPKVTSKNVGMIWRAFIRKSEFSPAFLEASIQRYVISGQFITIQYLVWWSQPLHFPGCKRIFFCVRKHQTWIFLLQLFLLFKMFTLTVEEFILLFVLCLMGFHIKVFPYFQSCWCCLYDCKGWIMFLT